MFYKKVLQRHHFQKKRLERTESEHRFTPEINKNSVQIMKEKLGPEEVTKSQIVERQLEKFGRDISKRKQK